MQALQQLIPLIFTLSLAGLVAAIGMDTTLPALLSVFRRPWMLLKAVLAVNVIVPLAAAVLIALLPIPPVAKGGIMLMAVSPVPPLAPGNELKAGGEKTFSYGLYNALILLAVIIVPLTVAIASRVYGVEIPLGPTAVLRNVALTVLVPLGLGLLFHRLFPDQAAGVSGVLGKAAMALLLLAFVPMLTAVWKPMVALVGNGAILAMALTSVVAILAGHLLGGPRLEDRGALAMAAATRHPGIALMIANAVTDDKRVTAAVLAFLLVGLIVATPYKLWLKRQHKAVAAAPATAANA